MGNPNVPTTKSEKEMEKAKEKIMKMMGLPLSTIFFHGNDQAILKNITPMGSTLIPRDIYTNIIVYPMTTDGRMIRNFDQKNASSGRPRTVPLEGAPRELRDAIRSNNVTEEKLRQILDREPSLYTSYNHEDHTPLSYAAYRGFTETVRYILTNYPATLYDPEAFPIHKACARGHLNILKMFHNLRGDESFFNADGRGRTPLHVAGDAPAEIFRYLITLPGARSAMSVKDENGETPRRVA